MTWTRLDSFSVSVALAVVLGFLVRASAVLASDFPLNDGGLFYAMIGDLQANGYRLPDYTSYNGGDIPFAYPPLALYLGALLADFTPLTVIDVLRFVPMTVSTLTIVAFALLARDALGRSLPAGAATIAFALLPRTFVWMIMGGGLTRSLGFLFAILGLWMAHRAVTLNDRRATAGFALCGSLAILTHLEMALLLAVGATVTAAFQLRDRRTAVVLAAAVTVMVAATAPWWGTILARHGVDPFVQAPRSNGEFQDAATALVRIVSLQATGELLFPLILMACTLGFVTSVARREFLLPAWLALAIVVDLRSFPTFATVPAALLAGLGWAEVTALVRGATARRSHSTAWSTQSRIGRAVPTIVSSVLLYYAVVSALTTAGMPTLNALEQSDRTAMMWASVNTPRSSAFAVISGDMRGWAQDEISEWFPALTGRRSVATVQGSEWLPHGAAGERLDEYDALQQCAYRDATCLQQWSRSSQTEFDYVYVVTGHTVQTPYAERFGFEECCDAVRASLLADRSYRLVYDGAGAAIFKHVGQEPSGRRNAPDGGDRFLTPSAGRR